MNDERSSLTRVSMNHETLPFPGFISLAFDDQVGRRELGLGMRGFQDLVRMDVEFEALSGVGAGASAFVAKKVRDGRVVQQKAVPAELVEDLLGASIAELIQKSRSICVEETPELSVAMGLGCHA